MKRRGWIIVGICALGVAILAELVLSGRLLQWGLHETERWVASKTPYELHVDRAHLHLVQGLVLDGLSLKEKKSTEPLLAVQELQLRLHWMSLLKRQVVIDKLTLVQPVVSVLWPLPASASQTPAASTGFGVLKEIRHFEIRDGSLTVQRQHESSLELTPISLEGALEGNRLDLTSYSIAVDGQSLWGDAGVVISTSPTFDVHFFAKQFAVPRVVRKFAAFPDDVRVAYTGEGHLAGIPERWRIQSDGEMAGGSLSFVFNESPTSETLACRFERIRISQLGSQRSVASDATVQGNIQARTNSQWTAQAHAEGSLRFDGILPHHSSASMTVAGTVDLENGVGQTAFSFQGQALDGNVQSSFETKNGSINAVFNLAAPQVAALHSFYPPLEAWDGAVVSSGTLQGAWKNPAAHVSIRATNLEDPQMKLATLELDLASRKISDGHFLLNASAGNVRWNKAADQPWDLENIQLVWDGDVQQGELQTHARFRNRNEVDGAGSVSRNDDRWRCAFTRLMYVFADSETWKAQPGGSLEFAAANNFSMHDLHILNNNGTLNVRELNFHDDHLTLDLAATQFPVRISVPVSSQTVSVNGTLDGTLSMEGPLAAPLGKFDIAFSSGAVKEFAFHQFSVTGTFDGPMVRVQKGRLETALVEDPILFHGNIPWNRVVATAPDVPMDLALTFGPLDPSAWIKKIPHAQADAGGHIQFDGHIRGRRKNLAIEGSLLAFIPRLKLSDYGLEIQDISLDIQNKNQIFRIQQGSAHIGKKGNLSISGESHFPDIQLNVSGKDIQFKMPRRLEFFGDAELALSGTWDEPELTGKLSVRRGTYEVPAKKKEHPSAPSSQAVYAQSFWTRTHMDVAAAWNNGVWYREGLTKIESQADIHVFKDRGADHYYLTGTISLLRGSYDAYGKDFVIKSGELTFTGPPDINPNLQLEAQYTSQDFVVDLNVSGTANQPKISLQSTPPMTEQEILSSLLTGASSVRGSSLNGSSSSATPGADVAASVLSTYMTNQIRASGLNVLSLDVLRVTPTASGNMWTVGRYLGPKFFFSYSTNSKDTANKVVNGEYILSPRWSIVGQTGSNTDDYMDIQFRVPWARKKKATPDGK